MTKRTIHHWFTMAIVYFVAFIAIGVVLSVCDESEKRIAYSTFKDFIPLFISIPAAWLAYCVQRRSAYLQQLRSLWSKLIDAIQSALQYTELTDPTREQHSQVLLKLSSSIDEVRGLFCNLDETEVNDGLYPFEPLKDIYFQIESLKYGKEFSIDKTPETKIKIRALWKDVRKEILEEFDREKPTFSHSHWADDEKRKVYDDHDIPKTPT